MRFLRVLPLLAALALPLAACSDHDDDDDHCHDPEPTAGAVGKLGPGKWVYSSRDQATGIVTYTPQTPPGWVRPTYVFAADGTVVVTVPGPNDGPVNTAGTWYQQGDDIHIMLPQSASLSTHLTWRLKALSATEMKVTVQ